MSVRRAAGVAAGVAAVAVLLGSGCGVTSQDEPQVIEESRQPSPAATPSFGTGLRPATSGSKPTTSSSPTPSTG